MVKIRFNFFLISFIFMLIIIVDLFPVSFLFPELKGYKIVYSVESGFPINSTFDKLRDHGFYFNNDIIRAYFFIAKKNMYAGKYRYSFDESGINNLKSIFYHAQYLELKKIKFHEGIKRSMIIHKLEKAKLLTLNEFIMAEQDILNDKKIKTYYRIHDVENLEGYLFPDTYFFYENESPKNIMIRFLNNFRSKTSNFPQDISPKDLYQKIIIASLIEKETGIDEEYLISSVIYNRLNKRMKLQIDATILYALYKDDIITNNITLRNKHHRSPYNTYVYYGLPPGPICNPGFKSIDAAFNPDKTDYLYYVSKNDGTHVFSKTYKEHQKWVDKYQRGRR